MKMSLYEAILARRSVRNYTTQKLGKATIPSLLEAAIRSPTTMHNEPWAFVIIQNHLLLKKLSDQAETMLVNTMHVNQHQQSLNLSEFSENKNFNIFYNAGTLILICGDTKMNFFEADCWLATENFILAACAMGLGTCIIGCALSVLNLPEVKLKLSIPDDFMVVVPIIVGYPNGTHPPTPRKHPIIFKSIPEESPRMSA